MLVEHPTRGRSIFIATDIAMPPIEVIRLYGLRFKIELSFKQALRVLGVYAYHFWMNSMDKIARGSRTQYLHRKSDRYRAAVRRKLAAYHRHIQVGLISQGMLVPRRENLRWVWASFGSWLRTVRPGIPPSESSPPRRCATRSRNFSQTQIPARYSIISSATASTPHATSLCGSPDR